MPKTTSVESLPALDENKLVMAIIECPQGSRNKYKYVPNTGMFECGNALKGGVTFPFDFGFVPSTMADDGDPLDIIILMDEPAFAGCLVHARIIGVMEAYQWDSRKHKIRNDRLIGVHISSVDYGELCSWKDLPKTFRQEIEDFFILENKEKGKLFEPIGWHGPKKAYALLKQSMDAKGQLKRSA